MILFLKKEIDRNNQIYLFQGNRNPFVDHPEYVEEIWSSTNDTEKSFYTNKHSNF